MFAHHDVNYVTKIVNVTIVYSHDVRPPRLLYASVLVCLLKFQAIFQYTVFTLEASNLMRKAKKSCISVVMADALK